MVSAKESNRKDNYIFGRDDKASSRLNYQHFWTTNLTKHLLHPEIKVDRSNMCIADVGTGTGVWLVDVAQHLPAGTKLYGFDLSSAQFPRSEWLPSNVKLIVQDAWAEVPSEWRGKFDIVNMRFMLPLIGSEAKYQKLISNIRHLLKPSGYLQWVDYDYQAIEAAPPHSSSKMISEADISKSATAQYAQLMRKPQAATDYSYFPIEAQNIAQKHELQLLSWDEIPIGPMHQSFWNQSNLLALEEMAARHEQQSLDGVGNNLRQMLEGLRQEYERGWSIKMTFFRWVLQVESM